MLRKKSHLWLVIPFSFLLGLLWSTELIQKTFHREPLTLKVISYSGLLNNSVIKLLQNKSQLLLEVTTAKSQEEYMQKIRKEDFDLYFGFQNEALDLYQMGFLQPICKNEILQNFVSSDFLSLKNKQAQWMHWPLFWGFLGKITTAEQKEHVISHGLSQWRWPKDKLSFDENKVPLWIYSLMISKRTTHPEAIAQFCTVLLKQDTHHQFVNLIQQASTYLKLKKNLPEAIYPHYLRSVPLSKIEPMDGYQPAALWGEEKTN